MKAGKLIKPLAIALALLFSTLLAGCQYLFPTEEPLQTPPLLESKEISYNTVDVERGDIVYSVQGVGRFESTKVADVYFANGGGRIKKINVKLGEKVKKGDVLIELDVGELEYDLKRAEIKLQIQQNDYAALRKQLRHSSDKTALKNAALSLESAELDVKQIKEQIENSELKSPLTGSVTYVTNANQGTQVDSYSTLVRVADQTEKMLIYQKDGNSNQFQIGMKVQVTLNNDGTACEGEVVSTPFDRLSYNNDTLDSLIFISVPDDVMKKTEVGDQARLVLVLDERKDVLKLPRNVVKTYMQRRFVQVLENGVKVEKDVQVGLETTTEVEILDGLKEGEKVIVN